MNNICDFYTPDEWKKVLHFSEELETPCQIILSDVIRRNFNELKKSLPYARIFYAVKANPAAEVIRMLNELGSNFDVASVYELRKLLGLGVSPDRISYGNTIKKSEDI